MAVPPAKSTSTMRFVVTCLVFGVPFGYRLVEFENMASTSSRPRCTKSVPSAVTSAWVNRLARPSKSPRSMRSAYVNTRSLMAKRASAMSDMAAPYAAAVSLCRGKCSDGVVARRAHRRQLAELSEVKDLLHMRAIGDHNGEALLVRT